MTDALISKILPRTYSLASRAYRDDPHWRSYLDAFFDGEKVADFLPDLVALTKAGVRDDRVRDLLLMASCDDTRVIVDAAMLVLSQDLRTRMAERKLAADVRACLDWLNSVTPIPPRPPQSDDIPF